MIDKLLTLLRGIPDHILALMVVGMGVLVATQPGGHDLAAPLIAAGLTMWKGNTDK